MEISKKMFLAISGIIFIIMGIFVLTNPITSLLALTFYLSSGFIISGIFSVIFWVTEGRQVLGSGEILLGGVIDLFCGILMIRNVGTSTVALLTFFTVFILVKGAIIFIFSFDLKTMGVRLWWLVALLGAIGILLGVHSITNISTAATLVIILMGISFISIGMFYFVILIESEKYYKYLNKHLS